MPLAADGGTHRPRGHRTRMQATIYKRFEEEILNVQVCTYSNTGRVSIVTQHSDQQKIYIWSILVTLIYVSYENIFLCQIYSLKGINYILQPTERGKEWALEFMLLGISLKFAIS